MEQSHPHSFKHFSHPHSFKLFFRRYKFLLIPLAIPCLALLGFVIWLVHDHLETRRLDATSVVYSDNLTAEFGVKTQVSDFIAHLDGSMVDDFTIDTSKLGPVDVEFEYHNIKNKKRRANFTIEVQDTTDPIVYGRDLYVVETNYDGDLTNLMLSGDNADDHPERKIVGKYDLKKAGDYQLQYSITDASGNQTQHPFTLRVVKPAKSSNSQPTSSDNADTGLPIADVIAAHKNGNTEIGIDVSSWQNDIDWDKVHSAGVEFVMIRVGYQAEYNGEFVLDPKFKSNITGALAAGLDVGVYFYSCASSVDEAERQANWVLEQVGDYPLTRGVVFDWEEWNDFNRAGISFYTLQKMADTFLATVEAHGYEGLVYGSKNHLDNFWSQNEHPVWLAQYYDYPTYNRPFQMWQLTDTGKVPGIAGYVDLDVRYKY